VFLPFGKEDNNDGDTCSCLFRCSGVLNNNSYTCKSADIIRDEDISLSLVIKYISEAKLVIPYRLHGLILAFIIGRNYIFYPYHQKLIKVNQTLNGHNPEAIKAWQKALFNKVINEVTT
jgi:exopolysaccharide biosynthesis predicted pyruvyltransferase EpsI